MQLQVARVTGMMIRRIKTVKERDICGSDQHTAPQMFLSAKEHE